MMFIVIPIAEEISFASQSILQSSKILKIFVVVVTVAGGTLAECQRQLARSQGGLKGKMRAKRAQARSRDPDGPNLLSLFCLSFSPFYSATEIVRG